MPIKFYSPSDAPSAAPRSWADLATNAPRPQIGDAITFIPPESSASKKPKAGVKVLSVHPDYAVGLGLVRLELAERVHGLPAFGQAVEPHNQAETGSLIVGDAKIGDDVTKNWRVWAGRGRSWYGPEEENTTA